MMINKYVVLQQFVMRDSFEEEGEYTKHREYT